MQNVLRRTRRRNRPALPPLRGGAIAARGFVKGWTAPLSRLVVTVVRAAGCGP
jgi:hypothetical protein